MIRKNWKNQNIDLYMLTHKIIKMLEKDDFNIIVFQREGGYEIFAEDSPNYRMNGTLHVEINGEPNDFSINLKIERERRFNFPLLLTTMFGGGYFLLKHLKSNEVNISFIKNLCEKIDKIISQISK
ncbi:hypothetical protein J7L29_03245 [Candidatus Bathyarchaeota archaeon]|nr:hypothetical protein [Candidatus Bathyarchaeota archaeon]